MGKEELAKQLVTYADAITAFSFVQSVAFGFALGQREFRESALKAPYLVIGVVIVAYGFYTGFIYECSVGVAALLPGSSNADPTFADWTRRTWAYRFCVVALAALLSVSAIISTMIGAHVEKTRKGKLEMDKKKSAS